MLRALNLQPQQRQQNELLLLYAELFGD